MVKVARRWAAGVGVVLLVSACATQKVEDVPDPPDLNGLVEQFQEPSAPLDEASALEVMTDFFGTIELVSGTDQLGPLQKILEDLGEAKKAQDAKEQARAALMVDPGLETSRRAVEVGGEEVEGVGFFRITRICNGWGEKPVPDKGANGVVQVTAVFSDEGFDPVVWGEFADCRHRTASAEAPPGVEPSEAGDGAPARLHLLDGEISIHTGDLLTGVAYPAMDYVIEFDGAIDSDGELFDGNLGLRFVDGGRVEVNLDVEQGNLVYFTTQAASEPATQGFRAANGEWICNFEVRQCVSEEDGTTIAF